MVREFEQWGMPKNGWFVAALWLLVCACAHGLLAAPGDQVRTGTPYTVDQWDAEEGLPNNEVLALTQTRDGYLWLGTLNGLVRFDGVHFTVFDESNTPGLNSSRIVRLFEDSQTNLWIGTETAGIAVLTDGQLHNLPEIGLAGPERRLAAACEDASGAVWLCLANGDFWRYAKGRGRLFRLGTSSPTLYRAIIAERSGPVWVGIDSRQSAIGPIAEDASAILPVDTNLQLPPTKQLDFFLASRKGGYWRLADGLIKRGTNGVEGVGWIYPWSVGIRVTSACEDGEGNLLVGTLGAGVFWFAADGKSSSISTKEGLSNNFILSLCFDHEGSLWVGTDGGGLNRVKRKVFVVLEEARDLAIQSVAEDGEEGLWFGANGGEIGHYKNGAVQQFEARFLDRIASVRAVFVDGKAQIWVGTVNAGLFQWRNDRFQGVPGPDPIQGVPRPRTEAIQGAVQVIHQDHSGTLWFGTLGGLLRWDGKNWQVFTTTNGLKSEVVTALADDPEGNLWIGTRGGGLSRLRDGKFTSYHKQDGLPSEDISSLYADAEGVLWIGTFGHGLARLHRGKWAQYTTRDGLISNSVGFLIEDGQGYLWVGSNRGLMRVKKKALNDFAAGSIAFIPLRAYGRADGLPTSECTLGCQPGACWTKDGKLWFPTTKGLAWVDPAQLLPNTNPPPVVIESVLIEGQPQTTNLLSVGWPQAVTIPAGKERLDIHYTSLNLAAPARARFRYRLEGHETAWTEVGNVREAHYTKLDPGHYRFRVTACNEDEVWNETGSTLAVIVEPPFWSTWWFRGSMGVFFLGSISAGVYYLSTQKLHRQVERLRQQEALEKERSRIARDIHDQLGASLTQVALLGEFVESDKNSPADVEAHAKQISQTARDTTRVLDEIVWTVNPSNDTLDGLVNYICKYAQDYLAVAELRYRLDVPADLPAAPLPPELRHNVFLAAKEAVTNIVRHAKASAAWIRLRLEPSAFILEIEDNGRGLGGLDEKAASLRNGLRNMRRRMEDVGGSFSMSTGTEGGTLVKLTAPLKTKTPFDPAPKGR